jgi:hypothetical protein
MLVRHAKYHCPRFVRVCPFGVCKVDLTNRAFDRLHSCFIVNKTQKHQREERARQLKPLLAIQTTCNGR